ncbi:hypothetical protein HHK36_023813 [Tetracentron sinense]|uniref:F-box domain-containing protein n=1 Tax=Tetracentron sinense TaxID=13715 RepID=A0A834YRT9_TETSI|nr:hypothetical protein HHK36_023813 [Tetracentron sinense]
MEAGLDPYLHLPEAILIFIISMLPLRDAMRTSAFTKSWYMLWTYTNSIDFDEKYFSETRYEQRLVCSGRRARTYQIKKVRRRRFIESVCHTLYRMWAPNISKFELKLYYKPKYHDFIYQWISFSMEKNIEELHLDFSTRVLRHDFNPFKDPQFSLPEITYYYGCKYLQSDGSICGFVLSDVAGSSSMADSGSTLVFSPELLSRDRIARIGHDTGWNAFARIHGP